MNKISFFILALIILIRMKAFAEILLTQNPSVDFVSNSYIALDLIEAFQSSASSSDRKIYTRIFSKTTWLGELFITFTAAREKSVLIHEPIGSSLYDILKNYEVTFSTTGFIDAGKYKFTIQDLATQNISLLAHWTISFK